MTPTNSYLELGRAVMRSRHPGQGKTHFACLNETELAVDLCVELGLKLQDVLKIYDRLEACDTASHPVHVARCMVAAEPFGFVDGKHQKILKIASHLHDTTPEAALEKAKKEA